MMSLSSPLVRLRMSISIIAAKNGVVIRFVTSVVTKLSNRDTTRERSARSSAVTRSPSCPATLKQLRLAAHLDVTARTSVAV